jgi:hypothetical protein
LLRALYLLFGNVLIVEKIISEFWGRGHFVTMELENSRKDRPLGVKVLPAALFCMPLSIGILRVVGLVPSPLVALLSLVPVIAASEMKKIASGRAGLGLGLNLTNLDTIASS